MRKPELLVPASSLEVLKVAVTFGADAVYIGGEAFLDCVRKQRTFRWKRSRKELHLPMSTVSVSMSPPISWRITEIWRVSELILKS